MGKFYFLYTDFLKCKMKIEFRMDNKGKMVLMWNQVDIDNHRYDNEWSSVGSDIVGGDDLILKYQNVGGRCG